MTDLEPVVGSGRRRRFLHNWRSELTFLGGVAVFVGLVTGVGAYAFHWLLRNGLVGWGNHIVLRLATGWEWVDPQSEGDASATAVFNNLSTVRDELGKKGYNWRKVLLQRQKEVQLMEQLGLVQTGANLRNVSESESKSESSSETKSTVESKSVSTASESVTEVESAFDG